MKFPNKVSVHEITNFMKVFLKNSDNITEEGHAYIKEITGYDLENIVDVNTLIKFSKDDTVFSKAIEDYQLFKTNQYLDNIYGRLNHSLYDNIDDMKTILLEAVHYSLSYMVSSTPLNINDIHKELFKDDIRQHEWEDNSEENDEQVSFQVMRLFLNSTLFVNTPFMSILNHCLDYKRLRETPNNEIEELWECVNRKDLRKLIKLLFPSVYDLMKTIIKNKNSVDLIKQGDVGRFIQKFSQNKYFVETNSSSSEKIFFNMLTIVGVLEMDSGDFLSLFNSASFTRLYFLYTFQGSELDLGGMLSSSLTGDIPVTMSNKVVMDVLKSKGNDLNGVVGIDTIIDGFQYDCSTSKVDAKDKSESLVMGFLNHTANETNKLLKNKGNTLKKFIDGEEVSIDFFHQLMQVVTAKALAVTHFNDLKDMSSSNQKKLRIREAIAMFEISGYMRENLPVVNVDLIGVKECSKYAYQINKHCMENGITEEVIFLMMSMLWTVMDEYSVLNANSIEHKQNELTLSEFETKKENKELKKTIEELQEEISKLREDNMNIKGSVNKEVERRTEDLYLSNYKLERQLEETKTELSFITRKYENLSIINNELHHDYEELLNKTDEDDKEDMTEMINYLKTKRVAMAGGYPRVIQSLQRLLPNVYIIPKEGPSMSIKSLDNNELILVYTSYMSHGLSYGIKANTAFDKKYLRIDKAVNAHELIRRAYTHMRELDDQKINSNPLE